MERGLPMIGTPIAAAARRGRVERRGSAAEICGPFVCHPVVSIASKLHVVIPPCFDGREYGKPEDATHRQPWRDRGT
jgi:hypothetical protein